jgi:hypothetical protein
MIGNFLEEEDADLTGANSLHIDHVDYRHPEAGDRRWRCKANGGQGVE